MNADERRYLPASEFMHVHLLQASKITHRKARKERKDYYYASLRALRPLRCYKRCKTFYFTRTLLVNTFTSLSKGL